MSDIDKFLDEPVSDTPAKTSAVDSFMEDAPDTAKGFGGALRDTAVAAGSGAVTGVQLLANAAGAGNGVAQKLGDAADYVRGFETEARREERAARAEKIKKAEASGSTWEEVKANVGAFAEAPIDTTVEALGTSLPTIAATALTRGKLRAPVAGAMGAAQGAGTVKGAIYDAVKQQHLDAGATPEEAEARAVEAQAYDGDNAGQIALGAGLGVAAGTTGVEGVVGRMLGNEAGEAAAQGVIRSTLLGAAKEAPLEAAQGGQERLASNIALQNEGFDNPTWQGVAGQAALEGLAGAAAGGGFGAVEGAFAHDPQSAPAVDPTELAGDEPAADPAPATDPVTEPQAPTAGPLAAGMPPSQVQPQYRTERPFPARPSEQMGLDPAAGALSDAAATAVDTGASAQLAQQAAEQQAAELAQKEAKKGAKAGEQIDTSTGEITQAAGDLLAGDRAAELQDDLNYVKQAARANGWDARLVAERDRLQDELALLAPAPDAGYMDRVSERAKRIDAAQGSEEVAAVLAEDQADPQRNEDASGRLSLAASARNFALEQIPPTSVQEGIAQAKAKRALADQADVSPETVTAPSAAEASTQPADQMAVKDESRAVEPSTTVEPVADQTTGDIKAITAKQIPQMTDAEIEQAIAYYGPDNKRTAKLQKEQAKRASASTQQPEIADGIQAPQAQQAGTQRAQAPGAAAEAVPAATESAAGVGEAGARWDAMTPAERQAVAEKAGVKPVFAKNLPNVGWDRIGASVRAKLSEAIDPELTASLAESKAGAQELAARAAAHEASKAPKIEGRDIGEQWNEMPPVRRRELMAQPGSPFTDAKGRLTAEAALLGSYPWDKQEASDQSAIEALLSGAATQQAASADQATVSPETVTAPAAADAASDSTTSPSEQVERKQADEYAARLRKLGDEFQGSYSGRSLAPLARAMADHAIEQGRRLTDAEIADMGKRFDVPADVVEQLTGNIFTFDAILGDAQRREPGAVALRKRQSQSAPKAQGGQGDASESDKPRRMRRHRDDPPVELPDSAYDDAEVEADTKPYSLKEGIEAVREQKAAAAQVFVRAPDGSLDFGEITPEMAKAAGRQAGKIRLQQGDEAFGLTHIELRHGAEIRSAGFADVPAFVADIARHIDEVWKPAATRQLVALHSAGKDRVMFVELQPGKDESGDFYTVKTAFPARPGYTNKADWKLLWEARAQASGDSGNRPSFAEPPQDAGGEATIPSSQSNDSIARPQPEAEAGDKAAIPISIANIKAGDRFQSVKYGNTAPTGGVIEKVGPANITFGGQYMGNPISGVKLPRAALVGGKIVRDGVVYDVVSSGASGDAVVEGKKSRGVPAKKAEAAEKARAEYFAPGNVVKSYGGHDRVVSYTPANIDGQWSVTVRAVEKRGDSWVDKPGERERNHSTQPDARELKAGPVGQVEQVELSATAQPEGADQAVAIEDFPLKEAAASYSGISHSGNDRAKSDKAEFEAYIDGAKSSAMAVAHTQAQRDAVDKAITELRADYLAQYRRLMAVRAGTVSSYVAGGSNFNSKQAGKRNSAYDRAIEAFTTWQAANTHKARKAALDARTDAEKAADQAAASQAIEDKAQKERDADLTLMRKILSWKKGGEPVAIGKSAVLDGVNKGRDGYPTSIKLKPTDGSTLADDKFDLAALFRNRKRGESVPDSRRRVRELVDAVRAEDATASAQEDAQAAESAKSSDSKTPLLDAHVAAMDQARDGKIDPEAFRAAFAQVEANGEAMRAEMNSMSKDKLLRAGGVYFYHRHKDDRKAEVVEALYRATLDEYSLGKSYGPNSYMLSGNGPANHRAAKAQALRDLVAGTDEAALQQFAAEIAESRKEREARKEATRQALENPKTLPEFRSFISYHAEKHSETRREAYLRLTPEQRRRYDELEAEGTREAREQAKNKQRTKIASAGNTTAGEVIATKHTKHGHDLYVVKLEERVSREDYDTLNSSAKRMGGSYSSYRGNGAIPGFQFRTREAAEAFRKLVAGDTEAAQEVAQARRDAFEDDRSQSAVERLRTMAAALNERAEEELGRDRKVNTARRARMASAAEAAANANKALAGTMENIADAIEAGKAKFLDLVRQKVQVEFLGAELRNAKDAQIRAKYPSYADQVKHRGQPIDDETVDYSDFPTYGGMRSDLAGIARQMIEVDGLKNLGQRLLKVADDVSDAYVEWAKNNLQSVSRFARGEQFAEFTSRDDAERAIRRSNLSDRAIVLPLKRGVNRIVLSPSEAMKQGVWQGDDKRIGLSGDFGREIVEAVGRRAGSKIKLPWQLETVHAKRKRLEGMGIYTGSEYRAALREFADLQQAMATPDKIKQMERAMIGRRSDGLDFFPTSEAVVDSMLEAAEIAEGMGVLEPSAGMGHIADAIREKTGVEPDVVELSGERRELLQAKGYHLAGDDFMAMQPRTFYTFGDIFQAPDGTKGIMRGGRAWSGRASLHAINEDDSEGKMLGWYDRDDLTGIEQRGSWSGYDRIVMNPPFSKGRDIQHVQHAYSLLKPGGRLVAIMGEGAFFQSNSAAEGFRAWLDDLGATSERLPENSFMDAALPVNTAVNARMVVIDKPATDTSGITADSARRAAVRARVAANNYSREDENFLQGMLKALYEKTGDSVLEHKLSTWLDSRYQRLEAVDQLYAEHDKAFAGKDDVLFSRRPVNVARGATPVLSHDAVKAIVERVNSRLNLGTQLAVYRSEAELFAAAPEIERQAENDQAKGQINAVYHNGKVHVVTSAFARSVDVESAIVDALAHEGQGHYGVRALFSGDRQAIDAALREFFAAIGGVAGVRRLAAKNDIDLSLYLQTADGMGERQRAGYLADELLAHLQGKAATAGLTQRAKAAIQAYLGAIREWLRGHGFPNLAKGTDADIALLLKRMRDAATLAPAAAKGEVRFSRSAQQTGSEAFRRWFGKSKVVGADGQPMNLYHGTAADFTVFDQGRAGSATGHATSALGIFMSSDRRAAQNYAEKASDGMPGYGRVMDLYASIQNPYLMSVEESQEVESPLEARRLRTRLEQQGYDGIRLKGTPVWIAFNNYQVKSATDNSGAFDEFDPDIRFSRSAVRGMASRATQELNRTFSAPGGLSWWHKTVGTMYNLAQRSPHFKPVFEAAQGFIDDVSHYASDAAELAPKLLPKLETLRDIAKSPVKDKDNKAIAAPIFEGTLMWARDEDGKPVRLDESSERKPGIVWTDAELRSMWSLSDGQIELYREFREAINRSLDTMARSDMLRFGGDDVKAMRERVMDAADAKEASLILQEHLAELIEDQPERAAQLMDAAKGIKDRAERVAQLQAEGYAPLSRFGKYTVDVVGEDGARQYFSLFETKREANLMAEQMRAAFPGSTVSQGTLSEEAFKLFAGITPETLELFGNAMGLDSSGDGARDKVFQDYLKLTKTNRSAMKRLIHRKGIAGYSEDVGRVLASFVYSNARQTAAGLNMGDLSESVNAIPQEQGELKDAAVRLAEYIKNPQEEAQALRGLLFAQYLGGSVASAFVNMTQPVAVTFPWLSQYGGAKRAAKELGKAARQMATKGHQYEADLARALHLAEEDGTVSPQEVHQLMAQASGTGGLRAGDGTRAGDARALASNSLARLSLAWGKMFGAAEEVNRRMTFIAAYRIAKADGNANPEAFARLAVRETQFVYSKASKMRWGRGAVGGTLMTFKTYSIAYLELMGRLWNQGEAGSQARKDGRKAALLMLATLLLLSGAGGLPFAEDAEDLIDGMAQLAGYNFSTQKAKEQFLHDVFGDDIARFIDKGITGLPGAPLDVSGRLGMGNLIPGTGLLQQRDDHSRDVLEIAGPAGDLVKRMISGAHKVASGEVGGGLLEMSPAAVRNLAKGADMAATGMYRDDKGYKVLETSTLEAALKAIGFQPQSVASIQEANWLGQRSKAFYSMRAQEIRALWAQGVFEKDPSKVQEARDAVADWNASNPDQPMLISVPDVMRRVREMGKSKDQRIADAAPRAMRQQLREDFARVRGVFEE